MFCRHRPREQEALRSRAAVLSQENVLFFRLNAFGDNLVTEAFRHCQNGLNDRAAVMVIGKTTDEASVDLECVERQTLKMRQT